MCVCIVRICLLFACFCLSVPMTIIEAAIESFFGFFDVLFRFLRTEMNKTRALEIHVLRQSAHRYTQNDDDNMIISISFTSVSEQEKMIFVFFKEDCCFVAKASSKYNFSFKKVKNKNTRQNSSWINGLMPNAHFIQLPRLSCFVFCFGCVKWQIIISTVRSLSRKEWKTADWMISIDIERI